MTPVSPCLPVVQPTWHTLARITMRRRHEPTRRRHEPTRRRHEPTRRRHEPARWRRELTALPTAPRSARCGYPRQCSCLRARTQARAHPGGLPRPSVEFVATSLSPSRARGGARSLARSHARAVAARVVMAAAAATDDARGDGRGDDPPPHLPQARALVSSTPLRRSTTASPPRLLMFVLSLVLSHDARAGETAAPPSSARPSG